MYLLILSKQLQQKYIINIIHQYFQLTTTNIIS